MERSGGLTTHLGREPFDTAWLCKRGRQVHLEASIGFREVF